MHVTLARKVTKRQIQDDSISQNELHMVYNMCAGTFHAFMLILYEYASLLMHAYNAYCILSC